MSQAFRIAVGADHGGVELKDRIADHLRARGHVVQDCGTHGKDAVDYPTIARAVALLVASGACQFGVMVDGAGIGSAMAANKVPGVLAAACYTEALARNSREHNDANVLTLGAGQTPPDAAIAIVDIFLSTACTADRHRARVQMIRDMERDRMSTPSQGGPALSAEDVTRIAERVRQLLQEQGGPGAGPAPMPLERVASLIDHTLLKPEATVADIQRLCDEARRHRFFSVCVNPELRPAGGDAASGQPGEGVLRRGLSARRAAARGQGARGAPRDSRGRARDRHGHQHRRAEGPRGRRRAQGHPVGGGGLQGRPRHLQGDPRDGAAHRRGEDPRLRAEHEGRAPST